MPFKEGDNFERDDTPREECGVFGVMQHELKADDSIAQRAYLGLLALQHRGEDGAGIALFDPIVKRFNTIKETGLVASVFGEGRYLNGFESSPLAVAHTRYGTGGEGGFEAVHPHHGSRHGFVLAQNGHIQELEHPIKTDTQQLVELVEDQMDNTHNLPEALLGVLRSIGGGYGIVASDGERLIGARDPHGLRPLCFGQDTERYYFSSEDSALPPGCEVTMVEPGEMVVLTKTGIMRERIYDVPETMFCTMEESYFASPNTNYDGRNVQQTRMRKGELMASQEDEDFTADIVVGVPESGLDDALGYANATGMPFTRAITKNQYIGRTFIQSSQKLRAAAAELKFRINQSMVDDKSIVLVDDSLVRGTNSLVLVQKLRAAGARQVHLRIMFPPHSYSCHSGIDTGDPDQLLANRMTHEQMVDYLKVDSLKFITPENLQAAIAPKIGGLCMACVTGNYPSFPANTNLGMPQVTARAL